MVRTISNDALAKVTQAKGTEPINIIKIEWENGTFVYYSDKEFLGCKPAISELSNLDDILNINGSASSSSVSITLDDFDDHLRQLINKIDIHKKPCTILQCFEGLTLNDAFPIFKGIIITPIEWNEGSRTLKFDIESKVFNREVGFSPEEGQFENIPRELFGKTWPICFGTPIHVPATQALQTLRGGTASSYGLPDLTLTHKRRLIEINLRKLEDNLILMNNLITKANALTEQPISLQDQYADIIIEEDSLKQQREDLLLELNDLNSQMKISIDEYEGDPQNPTIGSDLDKLKRTRDFKLQELRDLASLRAENKFKKDFLEKQNKNSKYSFAFIGKIRTKISQLRSDYDILSKQLRAIDLISTSQQSLQDPKGFLVTNGNIFPQNKEVQVDIENQRFSGIFTGNRFLPTAIIPTYSSIVCGPKLDLELNTFFISDPLLKLNGKYALLPNGMIIRMNQQSGLKIYFELKQKPDDSTFRKSDIDTDNKTLKQAREGLNRLLQGNESDEEIMQIMNEIPKDLSTYIKKKLAGGLANQYRLKLEFEPTAGSFTIIVNEFETEEIPYNATAKKIKDALGQIPILSTKRSNFEVEREFNDDPDDVSLNPMIITFDLTMFPIPKMSCNGTNLENKDTIQGLRVFGYPTSGKFKLKVDGHVTRDLSFNSTALEVQNALIATSAFKPGEVVCSGGPVDLESVKINSTKIISIHSFYFPSGDFSVKITKKVGLFKACAAFEVISEGAHEHTVGEIQSIIENALDKTQYDKPLKDLKKKMVELFNSFDKVFIDKPKTAEERAKNADNWEMFKEIAQYYKTYIKILQDIEIPQSIIQEAYRLISDKEYEHLLDFEILNYLIWKRNLTPIPDKLEEEKDKYFITGEDITFLIEVAGTILPHWVTGYSAIDDEEEFIDKIQRLPTTEAFFFSTGSHVELSGNFQNKFVCNMVPSVIKSVYAYKSVDGIKTLMPVPSRYYIKNENDTQGIYNLTTITLYRDLEDYENEFWEKEIYVTCQSSIGSNVSDIIKWIIENFTTFSVDLTSFNYVKTKLENYPANFALLEKKDALNLIEEIAWQARCAVWFKMGVAYIRYLPEEPASVDTITESDIDEDSLILTTTDSMDLVTKFTSLWRSDYSSNDKYKIIFRSNLTKYDEIAFEYDFYIYNIESLVRKAATFWLIRKANTFKRIKFTTPLHKLKLETWDPVTINLQNNLICNGSVVGIIEKSDYDSNSNSMIFEVWLPVLFGKNDKFDFAFPSNMSTNIVFPEYSIILGGNAGNPIGQKVPTGLPFDPLTSQLRPNDFGDLKVSDTGDELPSNPANDLSESDYESYETSDFVVHNITPISDRDKNEHETNEEIPNKKEEEKKTQIGTVRKLNKIVTKTRAINGTNKEFFIQYYDVDVPSGETLIVRQMQIHKDDRIPPNTAAYITYNKTSNEYEMQVPIFLGEFYDG